MPISTPVVVGGGNATASTTVTATLVGDVPASDETTASVILCFFQAANPTADGAASVIDVTDDGTAGPATGYEGSNGAGVGFPPSTLFAGMAMACESVTAPITITYQGGPAYIITNPLFTGDTVTLTFDHTMDYIRLTLVALTGFGPYFDGTPQPWPDGCEAPVGYPRANSESGNFFFEGGCDLGESLTYDTSIAPEQASLAFYLVTQAVDSIGGLTWVDGSVVTLDSWTDEGPDDFTGMLGYLTPTVPIANGTVFDFATTPGTPPPTDDYSHADTLWLVEGLGIPFCVPSPPGTPVFNHIHRAGD